MTESGSTTAQFRAGEALYAEGELAERLFIINAGTIRLYRRVFQESVLLETLGRGSVCGDIAFAEGASYVDTAVALDEVEAVVVPRDTIDDVLLSNPSVVLRLVSRMAARLTYAHFRLAAFSIRDVHARLMLQLRYEAERASGLDGAAFAPIPFDLPDALGLERPAVDAGLRVLGAEGLLEFDQQGRFRIPAIQDFDRKLRYLELRDRYEP